ncbi:hypothetical protein CHRY9390_01332 [Chryseobacterium aquaeductus]|uniref:YdhG-like domain-containing protein n=1 Tax=Chryseobacterium aquaeductus TaxID=2675056 RepID=A0A9N8MF64_9FLAO|nr:DUF1801 domain-containing protein [Chryseobacterium aquaeductus]CAA7330661.1 hypothetical protein CHRY9390_01332 [Chryseobacterium potabilaquae]CAD7805198.1 hypothetical protein CHRY9390_01332 [Chryseobacterium aquaeductus]
MKNAFKTIDEYFVLFPKDLQIKLEVLRATIHSQHSEIEEYIGYQMPAFRYNGKPLVYFAGYKKHIGFYPGNEGITQFENHFNERKFKFSKGAVQFPLDKDLPLDLIKKIVQFRMKEIDHKKS